jgi:hypothetical protein
MNHIPATAHTRILWDNRNRQNAATLWIERTQYTNGEVRYTAHRESPGMGASSCRARLKDAVRHAMALYLEMLNR